MFRCEECQCRRQLPPGCECDQEADDPDYLCPGDLRYVRVTRWQDVVANIQYFHPLGPVAQVCGLSPDITKADSAWNWIDIPEYLGQPSMGADAEAFAKIFDCPDAVSMLLSSLSPSVMTRDIYFGGEYKPLWGLIVKALLAPSIGSHNQCTAVILQYTANDCSIIH